MDLQQQKDQLRKDLLSSRMAIPTPLWSGHSEKIRERLIKLASFQQANTIHCYISMNDRKEVNTHPLIHYLLKQDIVVSVPVTHIKEQQLTHHRLTSFNELQHNEWGVPEPKGDTEEVSLSELDLVIVPMVGGDEQCNRIGYGGGFYDRFLKDTSCPKIGLTFEQTVVPQIPVQPFDIPLDLIVTEKRHISS